MSSSCPPQSPVSSTTTERIDWLDNLFGSPESGEDENKSDEQWTRWAVKNRGRSPFRGRAKSPEASPNRQHRYKRTINEPLFSPPVAMVAPKWCVNCGWGNHAAKKLKDCIKVEISKFRAERFEAMRKMEEAKDPSNESSNLEKGDDLI